MFLPLNRTVRRIYFSFKLINYTGPFEQNNKVVLRFFAQLLTFNYSVTNNKSGHFLNSICLLRGKLNYSQLPNKRLRHESYILDSRARVYRKLSTNRTLCIWAVRQKICSLCTGVPQHFQHMRNFGSVVRAAALGTLLDLCKPQQTASCFTQGSGLFMPVTMTSMYSCIAHANPNLLPVNIPNSHPLKLVADVPESVSAKISPRGHVALPGTGVVCTGVRTCPRASVASNAAEWLQTPTCVAVDSTNACTHNRPFPSLSGDVCCTRLFHICTLQLKPNYRLMQLTWKPVLKKWALNA